MVTKALLFSLVVQDQIQSQEEYLWIIGLVGLNVLVFSCVQGIIASIPWYKHVVLGLTIVQILSLVADGLTLGMFMSFGMFNTTNPYLSTLGWAGFIGCYVWNFVTLFVELCPYSSKKVESKKWLEMFQTGYYTKTTKTIKSKSTFERPSLALSWAIILFLGGAGYALPVIYESFVCFNSTVLNVGPTDMVIMRVFNGLIWSIVSAMILITCASSTYFRKQYAQIYRHETIFSANGDILALQTGFTKRMTYNLIGRMILQHVSILAVEVLLFFGTHLSSMATNNSVVYNQTCLGNSSRSVDPVDPVGPVFQLLDPFPDLTKIETQATVGLTSYVLGLVGLGIYLGVVVETAVSCSRMAWSF